MRSVHVAIVMSALCLLAGSALTGATKGAAKKKATTSAKKASTAGKKGPSGTKSGKKVSSPKGVRGKAGKAAPSTTWRNRQQSPTPDRYREIQQALADKGYLKSEPNGVWDGASVAAMQHFQSDQKMTPSGKINAPSLIGLGLGAKSAGASEAPGIGTPKPPEQPPPPQ